MDTKQKRAIRDLRRTVAKEFPGQLQELLVFGSVARGTDTPNSDIDIMVILESSDAAQRWQYEKCLRDVAFPLELKHDVVFDLKLVLSGDLTGIKGHTPFMENVLGEGVSV